MKVEAMNRDEDCSSEDTVGSFNIKLTSGMRECKIISGILKTKSGTFFLNVNLSF